MSEGKVVFKSGASRTENFYRYDLLPKEALDRWAQRMTEGAIKHGDNNWRRGLADPEFIRETKNHLFHHVLEYLHNGCSQDDNLAAIMCNAAFLMWFDAHGLTAETPANIRPNGHAKEALPECEPFSPPSMCS